MGASMPIEIVPHEPPPPEADVVEELLLLLLLPHPAATIAKAATNARALTLLTLKLPPHDVPNPGCDSILLACGGVCNPMNRRCSGARAAATSSSRRFCAS